MVAQGPHEVEAALLARGARPGVLDEVARLDQLGPYRLRGVTSLHLRDRYFDTWHGDLALRRLALRLRESDGECLLALKGESQRMRAGISRLELEEAWTSDAVGRVRATLEDAGVPLPKSHEDRLRGHDEADEPAERLGRMGLRVIQERETERRRRTFIHPDRGERVLAELDIDSVVYRIADHLARLFEVEIELRDPTFDLATAVESLVERVPGLVPWVYSKLAVGKALERALAEGRLALSPDGTIPPEGYDEIERMLSTEAAEAGASSLLAPSRPPPPRLP
jgi:CYTH domain